MGAEEVRAIFSHLAHERNVAGATYTQVLRAFLFLFKEVLKIDLSWIEGANRPKRLTKRQTGLIKQEVTLVLEQMEGGHQFIGRLLYGTGMRFPHARSCASRVKYGFGQAL